MTKEEINIAIAEMCGWDINPADCGGWVSMGKWCKSPNGKLHFKHNIPNYHGDLNAMHEAEETLTDEQFEDYHEELLNQAFGNRPQTRRRHACSAKAAQRAEAFLRVHNLWRE